MSLESPGKSAGNTPAPVNDGSPVYKGIAATLKEIKNSHQNDLKGNANEDKLHGLILSSRGIPVKEFEEIYKGTWLHNSMTTKDTGTDKSDQSLNNFYECHVYIEELCEILPDVDFEKIRKFNSSLQKVASQTSGNEAQRDEDAKNLVKNPKEQEAVKLEVAKISMFPIVYYAHPTKKLSFGDVVTVAVQKNSVTKFLGRVDKVYNDAAITRTNGT